MYKMRIDSLLFSKSADSFKIYDSSGLSDIAKLRQDVVEISSILRSVGLRPNENIAIVCDNHSCFLSALLSIAAVGAIAVPIDPQISSTSLKEIVRRFNIRCAFIYGKRASEAFGHDFICECIFYFNNHKWENSSNIKFTYKDSEHFQNNSDQDPAIILLTSGTTNSIHKGVVISHRSIMNNIESIINYMQPQKTESLYIAKSLSHTSSVIGELLMALTVGMTLYIYNPVVPYSILVMRLMKYKPDYLVVNPTLLHFLTKFVERENDKPKIKGIYTCGGFSSVALINKARETFSDSKVYNMYGLTEAGPRVTAQTDEPDNYEAGYAGKPIKNVSVKIINNLHEADVNEAGRIFVKSNALMIGYYEDPRLTHEKVNDSWIDTGDVGYLNANQELYVLGRSDDVVIRSGKNINLNIVESIISEMDAIRECIVFSVPDMVYQNKIICAYTKNSSAPVNISEIREYCLKRLFSYECPQLIIEWDTIPKTNTNKKSRKKAVDFYQQLIR